MLTSTRLLAGLGGAARAPQSSTPSDSPRGRAYVLRYGRGEFARSAFKHGLDREAIEHARAPQVLAIGPDVAGNLLEIIWLESEMSDVVIHAMANPKIYWTRSGRTLNDGDLDAIANEVETTNDDVEGLKTR